MALFKVKINCCYMDLLPKTNIPKKVYKSGEFLELENANIGDQPERLVEATEEEIEQYKAGLKIAPVVVPVASPESKIGDVGSEVDASQKEASKAKLLADNASPVVAPVASIEPVGNAPIVEGENLETPYVIQEGDSIQVEGVEGDLPVGTVIDVVDAAPVDPVAFTPAVVVEAPQESKPQGKGKGR